MAISLKNRQSLPGWVVLGILAASLLGLFMVIPGCMNFTSSSSVSDINGLNLAPAPKVGRLAPDFTLSNLQGEPVTLSDLRGKTIFINFWATWCPPCRAEMPDIEAVYQEYKDKDVVVIGVDIAESKEIVRQFVQQGGYNWSFLLDTDGAVAAGYRVTSIPTSFFIDKQGIITAVNSGAMTKRDMESQLTKAMR